MKHDRLLIALVIFVIPAATLIGLYVKGWI